MDLDFQDKMIYLLKNRESALLSTLKPELQLILLELYCDSGLINYVKDEDIFLKHISKYTKSLYYKYPEKINDSLKIKILNVNPYCIQYFENPNEELQLIAVEKNLRTSAFIKNRTKTVDRLLESKGYF